MNLYQQFGTNKNQEKSGIYLQYGSNSKNLPIRFLVARAGGANTAFAKALEAETRPHRRQIQTGTLPQEIAKEINLSVYAKAVVLGWENVEDADGKPIPYSVSACIKLFKDLPDLFSDIEAQATSISLYQDAITEDDAKN